MLKRPQALFRYDSLLLWASVCVGSLKINKLMAIGVGCRMILLTNRHLKLFAKHNHKWLVVTEVGRLVIQQ